MKLASLRNWDPRSLAEHLRRLEYLARQDRYTAEYRLRCLKEAGAVEDEIARRARERTYDETP